MNENIIKMATIQNILSCGKKLKASEKVVLCNIINFHNMKVMGYWNNTPQFKLFKDSGLSDKTFYKTINNFVSNGLISVIRNSFGKANDYSPNLEAIEEFLNSSLSKNTNIDDSLSKNTNIDDSLSKNTKCYISKNTNIDDSLSKNTNIDDSLSKNTKCYISKNTKCYISKNTKQRRTIKKEKENKENNIYSYNPIMDLKESMDSINENEINNKLGLDDSMDYSPNNDNQNQNDNNKLGLDESLVDNPNNGETNPIDGIKTFDSFDSSERLGMSETAETCEDETNEWNKKDKTNEVNHTVQDSNSPLQGESKVELNNNNLGLEKSDYSPNGFNPNQNDNKENRNNPNHSNGETEPTIGNMQTSDNSDSVGLVDSPSGTIPKANNTSKGQYRPNLDYISKMEAIALGNPSTTETTTAYPTSEELDGLVLCNLDTQSKRNGAATKIIQGAQRIGTLHSTLLRMNEWLVQRIQDPNEDMALAYHAAINTFDDFEERMSNGQRNLFVMDLNQVYNNLKTAGYTVWDNYTPPKEYNTKDTQSKVVF